jgi:hypothetical protein
MSQIVLIKKVPLMSDLPRSELDNLATTLQIVTLQPGDLQPASGNPHAIPVRRLPGG